jgi:hypothetical protein
LPTKICCKNKQIKKPRDMPYFKMEHRFARKPEKTAEMRYLLMFQFELEEGNPIEI